MTRELSTENSGSEYIQYRGAQTSVTLDDYPVVFEMESRTVGGDELRCHAPFPVVGPDGAMSMETAQEGDDTAIWHEIADQLTETNPLISYGVACELCDSVFDTPQGLNSHMRTHVDTETEESTDNSDDDTDQQDEEDES